MVKLTTICQYITFVGLSFFWIVNIPQAWGEPVTTIRDNGAPANRVDFVILGDGYTESDLPKYANNVEEAVVGFLSQEPFKEYQNYFNFHRVDVISNESGTDHPPDVYKDTALDATYNCGGTQRAICVNYSKVDEIVSNSVNPDQRDIILILVNDTEYGGSGGALAVASTHASCIELVLHEVGHSFGLLADEYDYGSCTTSVEPSQQNVTMEKSRDLIKWNTGGGPPTGWVDFDTPIPTNDTINGIPGLYEGAKYCPSGVYRPTFDSKMRSLNRPFEQVNEEQLIKRVYNWVSPLDSSSPSESELTLQADEIQLFRIETLEPLSHSLDIEWYVDDQYQTNSPQFSFDSKGYQQGAYAIEVVIRDSTSKVRYDPANVLADQRSWTVLIMPSCDIDSDGDGTADCHDNCAGDPSKTEPGICGCGVADTDTDGDGTADCNDKCPNDPGKTIPGGCGCGLADIDSDGDRSLDCVDSCSNDPNKTEPGICGCGVADTDSDGDSAADCNDNCPNDPGKNAPGICGCGVSDADTDGDGRLDCNDYCPSDPSKTNLGICGCGKSDADSDGDGTADCNDSCPNDFGKTKPGVCGCGVSDVDTDHDSTLDCNDNCPSDGNKTGPGICGCGVPDTDTDADGTPNCNDNCPNDSKKTEPGICGCGVSDIDSDGDGIADCNDGCDNLIDSDGDGTNDCDDLCPKDPGKTQPGTCGCGIPDKDSDGDGMFDCEDVNDDDDGLPDGEEKGPGGNDPNYDGNNDAIADSLQGNVASFHTYDNQNYVTMESPAGTSISNCRGTGNPSKANAPADVEFPYGFFGLSTKGVGIGGATTVTLHLPAGETFATYYKYGPTPDNSVNQWYEFLFDGQTGAEINGNVVTLHFVDGMRGDDDLAANGVVTDVGAPAVAISTPGVENTVAPGGGGSCFIAAAVN